MLMTETTKPTSSSSWLPVPAIFIDRVMPRLRDTEWRLFLFVLRQTWGWQKERDWLSHRQLRQGTGRSSASLNRATTSLIRLQLIVVSSRNGDVIATPAGRRNDPAALFFSLHPRLMAHYPPHQPSETPEPSAEMRDDNTVELAIDRVVVERQNERAPKIVGDADSQVDGGNSQKPLRASQNDENLTRDEGSSEPPTDQPDLIADTGGAPEPTLDQDASSLARRSKDTPWTKVGELLKSGAFGQIRRINWHAKASETKDERLAKGDQ